MKTIPHIVVEPPTPATASVIWLHGLGADGHDFEGILPMLGLPPDHGIRFIFPHAPERPITVNDGLVMRGWYDISSFDFSRRGDLEGIESSVREISLLIDAELANGIPAERVILAGFSQGGVIALHAALRYRQKLAGVMALSTYLPYPEKIPTASGDNPVEIFFGHGTQDPIVSYSAGSAARGVLEERGYQIEWNSYPMEHSVSVEEISDISQFVQWILRINP